MKSEGLNIVVTGAGRGLGLEFVKQLLPRAGCLIATVRNPEGAQELQEFARSNAGILEIVPLDVSDEASIQGAVENIGSLVSSLDLRLTTQEFISGDRELRRALTGWASLRCR